MLIIFVCPVATISFAGAYAGTVVSMPLSGILASSWGWESLFYFFGKFRLLVVINIKYFILLSFYVIVKYLENYAEKIFISRNNLTLRKEYQNSVLSFIFRIIFFNYFAFIPS